MARLRGWVLGAAVVLAALTPALFAIAALGVRFGLLSFKFGFATLAIGIGPLLALAGLAVGALALALALAVRPRKGAVVALASFLVPLFALGGLMGVRQQAAAYPPIHDISTDRANPPGFSEALTQERTAAGANSLDLLGKRVPATGRFGAAEGRLSLELQAEAYPDVTPLTVGLPGQPAYDLALKTARDLGWRITREDPRGLTFEAQERSFWFGFTDDIVVRVTPGGDGSVIDIRSVSRVGVSDLGVNAARIRAFSQALIGKLERAGAAA